MLVAGGLRVGPASGIAGVLVVDDVNASRLKGVSVAEPTDVADWASRQATSLQEAQGTGVKVAGMVLGLGGDIGSLELAKGASGPMDRAEVKEWAAARNEIQIVDAVDAAIDAREVQAIPPEPVITLHEDVLDVSNGIGATPQGFAGPDRRSPLEEITRLVAEAWNCDVGEIEVWETERNDLFDVEETDPVWCTATELFRPGSGPFTLEE